MQMIYSIHCLITFNRWSDFIVFFHLLAYWIPPFKHVKDIICDINQQDFKIDLHFDKSE